MAQPDRLRFLRLFLNHKGQFRDTLASVIVSHGWRMEQPLRRFQARERVRTKNLSAIREDR
jgi:hypothetical protein